MTLAWAGSRSSRRPRRPGGHVRDVEDHWVQVDPATARSDELHPHGPPVGLYPVAEQAQGAHRSCFVLGVSQCCDHRKDPRFPLRRPSRAALRGGLLGSGRVCIACRCINREAGDEETPGGALFATATSA